MTQFTSTAMGIIFVLTYAGVALGRIPGLRLDRAGIARADEVIEWRASG